MDLEITIVADSNDGDYNTAVNPISQEGLDTIMPLIEAIKTFKPYKAKSQHFSHEWTHYHNYPCGEYYPREDLGEKAPSELYPNISEDAFELFEDLIPWGEHGIHTIKSIHVSPVTAKTRLL